MRGGPSSWLEQMANEAIGLIPAKQQSNRANSRASSSCCCCGLNTQQQQEVNQSLGEQCGTCATGARVNAATDE